MESFLEMLEIAWAHLTAATPVPERRALAVVVLAGLVAVIWEPTWRAAHKLTTVAHEGGHALAAVVTGRKALRVRVNADGSGTTHFYGRSGGFGATLVTFAGYPFPALVGFALLAASVSGDARQWTATTALALALLWGLTRNLHGWMVIGLCAAGAAASAGYLPGALLALGMAWFGGFFLAGALRDLMSERRSRRAGATDSDVARLGRRGKRSAAIWWTAMTGVVMACGWLAWGQVTGAYEVL